MQHNGVSSEFLDYLIEQDICLGERLPTLRQMSAEMGVSLPKLREQLEVARSMGIVSVRTGVGTRREAVDFATPLRRSANFALASGEATFAQFSQLRRALEISLWDEAVAQLTAGDHERLQEITASAWSKLQGHPIHVPRPEHRQLHLTIFSRLDNPFVRGVLETYWDLYEASELTRWADYDYWYTVWHYHQQIVDAICDGDVGRARRLLIEHFELLPAVPAAPAGATNNSNERSVR